MAAQFIVAMIIVLMHDCRIASCFVSIGCIMAGTCHAEEEYPQDDGYGKKD